MYYIYLLYKYIYSYEKVDLSGKARGTPQAQEALITMVGLASGSLHLGDSLPSWPLWGGTACHQFVPAPIWYSPL